jgi:hypothetical protein
MGGSRQGSLAYASGKITLLFPEMKKTAGRAG